MREETGEREAVVKDHKCMLITESYKNVMCCRRMEDQLVWSCKKWRIVM
jgi:hypothetical protein